MSTPLRLRHDAAAATGDAAAKSSPVEPVRAWLDVVARLLWILPARRTEVLDELDDHLRQRMRDLMLTGEPEARAARRAIEELGDAAALAHELTRASCGPRRRRLMTTGLIGFAVVSAAVGIVALNGGTPPASPAVSMFAPAGPGEREARAKVEKAVVAGAPADSLAEFFQGAAKAAGLPLVVHWPQLRGLHPDMEPGAADGGEPLGFNAQGLSFPSALTMLNDQLNLLPDDGIDWRVVDGALVIATTRFFDRQETTLATYDVGPIIEREAGRGADPDDAAERLAALIQEMVCPTAWVNNGGDLGALSRFGRTLFVRAPRRIHEQVRWTIERVMQEGPDGTGALLRLDAVIEGQPRARGAKGAAAPPLLTDIPLIGAVHAGTAERATTVPEAPAGATFEAAGSQVRMTLPDGSVLEARRIRVGGP